MIDEADLVLVAEAATGTDAGDLLAACDVGALARVVAEVELAPTATRGAAALLVAMDRHRPFPAGNAAVAWLAAAHLLDTGGFRLDVDAATARLVGAAGDVDVVEAALDVLAVPRRRSSLAWLVEVRQASTVLPCPTCGRLLPLRGSDATLLKGSWSLSADVVLRARCAVTGGPHSRTGAPRELVPA